MVSVLGGRWGLPVLQRPPSDRAYFTEQLPDRGVSWLPLRLAGHHRRDRGQHVGPRGPLPGGDQQHPEAPAHQVRASPDPSLLGPSRSCTRSNAASCSPALCRGGASWVWDGWALGRPGGPAAVILPPQGLNAAFGRGFEARGEQGNSRRQPCLPKAVSEGGALPPSSRALLHPSWPLSMEVLPLLSWDTTQPSSAGPLGAVRDLRGHQAHPTPPTYCTLLHHPNG